MATFFDQQQQARKNTLWLCLLMIAAVFAIISMLYGLSIVAWMMNNPAPNSLLYRYDGSADWKFYSQYRWWNPDLFYTIAFITVIIVAIGATWKIFALSRGGHVVAEWLGGRLILPNSKDPIERRVLNVVEEISIACGIAVPPVYLMDDESCINAFAAGWSPHDAVIGVTKGCVQLLSRDELQGVIAHEFSHILNGDMRLNIRLIGILNGILVIALIGRGLLNLSSRRHHEVQVRVLRKGTLGITLIGFGLLGIGSLGVFFANLIKAAVSRQREFLADASAVQFTRNPSGIGGALKKIGGFYEGSSIAVGTAKDVSHLFFSQGVSFSLARLMATHPPLEERISRIDPSFNGDLPEIDPTEVENRVLKSEFGAVSMLSSHDGYSQISKKIDSVDSDWHRPISNTVGSPSAEHFAYGQQLFNHLPEVIISAAREPYSARAVVYALLLDEDPSVRQHQVELIFNRYKNDPTQHEVWKLAQTLYSTLSSLPVTYKLPILDVCIPALRNLSANQYRDFRDELGELINADRQCSPFEYALYRTVMRHLDTRFSGKRITAERYSSARQLRNELSDLILSLAYMTQSRPEEVTRVVEAAYLQIPTLKGERGLPKLNKQYNLKALDEALNAIDKATFAVKSEVLNACEALVMEDSAVSLAEYEFLRAIADSFDCPIPPRVGPPLGPQTGQ